MKREFVPYELAVKLKALGFDESCLKSYGTDGLLNQNDHTMYLSAPLFQQAFRFFREKYNLYSSINIYNDKWLCVIKSIVSSENEVSGYIVDTINNGHPTFNTYEEAELNCLQKLIEIVEQKNEK